MVAVKQDFDPKNMPMRRLGNSGLRVPVLSYGGWLTVGGSVVGDPVKELMQTAFDHGCNMFDTAEGYAKGKSEEEMGRVIKEVGWRRTDLVISTKIYFGTRTGPNDTGLSRKHIVEGLKESLDRLQMDYVDIVFAHRPDSSVPMEEVVKAFNHVIEKGWAFYWGTSEWSAQQLEQAWNVANRLGLIGPIAEQCQHHMFHRERPEKEYAPIYRDYGMGTTIWSPLASGLLTGKYNDGIPDDSRFAKEPMFKGKFDSNSAENQAKIKQVRELTKFASDEFQSTPAALALAWCAKHPQTSTVILGATKPSQLVENFKALDIIPKLTQKHMDKIDEILGNKPAQPGPFMRPALDTTTKL